VPLPVPPSSVSIGIYGTLHMLVYSMIEVVVSSLVSLGIYVDSNLSSCVFTL
jgi:hypothetical protein